MKLREYYKKVLKNWFGKEESDRVFINKVIEILERHWNDKNIFIIEAPTGYGKSSISATLAIYSFEDPKNLKCIITFPLRTLLEDQYCKFIGEHKVGEKVFCEGRKSVLEDLSQEKRKEIIGKRYMHNPDSRYLIKPITLTTIDTLSLTLFGIPPEALDKVAKAWDGTIGGSLGHYLFSWASVALSNLVLDEVHLLADSTKSLSFLIALMKIAVDFDQKLILMSATIPESLKVSLKELLKELGIDNRACFINFKFENISETEFLEYYEYDEKFVKERLKKRYEKHLEGISEEEKFEKIFNWIINSKEFKRVIVVFNTARDAVEFYSQYSERLREIFGNNIVLLHSRFSEEDREKKNEILENLKEKDHYLIISTQVIEAGVDISSNLFITEIAPANSLIQRLGRFLRYKDEKEGKMIIWYEIDENKKLKTWKEKYYKVYDYNITEKTLKQLKENLDKLNVHIPEAKDQNVIGYKELLNSVYDRNSFMVNKNHVKEFCRIFLHLENASLVSIEKFFEMEGSFVREGLIVPVISEEFVEYTKKFSEIDIIRKFVVPISFEHLVSEKKNICGALVKRDNKVELLREVPDFVLKSPKNLLRYLIRGNVLAIVLRNYFYDHNRGLLKGD